ncbi:MAG: DUF3592 domain-containing protein [Limnothrix sp. RL_2_0]|nr:DUF3592 domain-containing protein [Limnothrix sp. RL_2_0]
MSTASQLRVTLLFSGILTIGGVALILFGISFLKDANASKNWPIAPGQVQSTRPVRSSSNRKYNPTYHYAVTYRYEVEGRSFTNDRYSLGDGPTASKRFQNQGEAIAAARKDYPVGQAINIYYNPTEPSSSVIKPGVGFGTLVPLVMGCLFLPSGIGLLLISMQRSVN